jgi:hypothetical protein
MTYIESMALSGDTEITPKDAEVAQPGRALG